MKKGEFGSGFGENIGCIREWNFEAVGVGAIDVVEAYGVLRHNFQRAPCPPCKHLCVDGIAQSRDQAVDAGLHLIDNQALRRSLWLRIDFDLDSRGRGAG